MPSGSRKQGCSQVGREHILCVPTNAAMARYRPLCPNAVSTPSWSRTKETTEEEIGQSNRADEWQLWLEERTHPSAFLLTVAPYVVPVPVFFWFTSTSPRASRRWYIRVLVVHETACGISDGVVGRRHLRFNIESTCRFLYTHTIHGKLFHQGREEWRNSEDITHKGADVPPFLCHTGVGAQTQGTFGRRAGVAVDGSVEANENSSI